MSDLKTPQQWAMDEGMYINDPRGWADGADFNAPTTYEDYHGRMLSSGLVPYSHEFGLLGDAEVAAPPVETIPLQKRSPRRFDLSDADIVLRLLEAGVIDKYEARQALGLDG